MKKLALFLLVAFLCAIVLCSCTEDKPPVDETTDPQETTSPNDDNSNKHIRDLDPSKFSKSVEFELPEDLRQGAVDYMYEQASVEWICAESFGVKEEWEHWGIDIDFQKGVKYTGQPYANSQVNVALFKRVLENGAYTSPSTSWDDVHGSQCVSSILNALQQSIIVDGWSYSFNPGSERFQGKILGDYEVEAKPTNKETPTSQVCRTNGKDKIYAAYALAQKGDVILSSNDWVHARMVVDVTVVKNNEGELNPNRSIIKCVEQTNALDTGRTDGVKTTWRVDKAYTFKQLFSDGYLPCTFEAFETGISHIPYIGLEEGNKDSNLSNKILTGVVRSNYPLRYVVLEILDENGEIVKEYTARGEMNDYTMGLRKHSKNLFGDGLEKGNYTFVMTAGIAAGETEFERIDFTVS